nr:hypothetical protein Iba_chr12dCG5780 [Ipomoea batatas]
MTRKEYKKFVKRLLQTGKNIGTHQRAVCIDLVHIQTQGGMVTDMTKIVMGAGMMIEMVMGERENGVVMKTDMAGIHMAVKGIAMVESMMSVTPVMDIGMMIIVEEIGALMNITLVQEVLRKREIMLMMMMLNTPPEKVVPGLRISHKEVLLMVGLTRNTLSKILVLLLVMRRLLVLHRVLHILKGTGKFHQHRLLNHHLLIQVLVQAKKPLCLSQLLLAHHQLWHLKTRILIALMNLIPELPLQLLPLPPLHPLALRWIYLAPYLSHSPPMH